MAFDVPANVDLGTKEYPIPISKAMILPLASSENTDNGLHIIDDANGLDIDQVYGESDVTVTIKDNKTGTEETFRYVDGILEVPAETPVVEAEAETTVVAEEPAVAEEPEVTVEEVVEPKVIRGFSKKTVPTTIKTFSKPINKYSMKQFSRPKKPSGAIDRLCSKYGKYREAVKLGDDMWAYWYEIEPGIDIKWNCYKGKPNGQLFIMSKEPWHRNRKYLTWNEEKANDSDFVKALEKEIEKDIDDIKAEGKA